MKLTVPFYSNTEDNTHCYQAAFRMVLKYFLPEKDFSWEELEKITAKITGLWTWPGAGMLWMQKNNFEVMNVDTFDLERFVREGGDYLLDEFGEEMGRAQIEHSDIEQERRIIKEVIEKIKIERRVPDMGDIKNLLKEGYLIICNVNSKALNQKEGYSGHVVVLIGFNEQSFFIHDPGLPPINDREVSFKVFEKAWAYLNDKAKNILAFKLK